MNHSPAIQFRLWGKGESILDWGGGFQTQWEFFEKNKYIFTPPAPLSAAAQIEGLCGWMGKQCLLL